MPKPTKTTKTSEKWSAFYETLAALPQSVIDAKPAYAIGDVFRCFFLDGLRLAVQFWRLKSFTEHGALMEQLETETRCLSVVDHSLKVSSTRDAQAVEVTEFVWSTLSLAGEDVQYGRIVPGNADGSSVLLDNADEWVLCKPKRVARGKLPLFEKTHTLYAHNKFASTDTLEYVLH